MDYVCFHMSHGTTEKVGQESHVYLLAFVSNTEFYYNHPVRPLTDPVIMAFWL